MQSENKNNNNNSENEGKGKQIQTEAEAGGLRILCLVSCVLYLAHMQIQFKDLFSNNSSSDNNKNKVK